VISINLLINFSLSLTLSFVYSEVFFYPLKLWLFLGDRLGKILSKFILGSVYIFLLLPFAFILKILGKDPMYLKFKNYSYKSTWSVSNQKENINFDEES